MPRLPDNLLLCPACGTGFLALPSPRSRRPQCGACNAIYPITDGVIDLLPAASTNRNPAQKLMESPALVRIYESRLWRRNPMWKPAMGISFEREQELIFQTAHLRGKETVLDLACGPGIYSRPLAGQVEEGLVVGLDLSMPMLRYAAQRAREQGLENILFVRGNALNLPFQEGRFDFVNCCGALHLFPDIQRVLGEICRVLIAEGLFTAAAIRRPAGKLGEFRSSLRRRLYGLRSFTQEEIRAWLHDAGLTRVRCHHAKAAWLIVSARKPEKAA